MSSSHEGRKFKGYGGKLSLRDIQRYKDIGYPEKQAKSIAALHQKRVQKWGFMDLINLILARKRS